MQIKHNPECRFGDLTNGQVFVCAGSLYIKCCYNDYADKFTALALGSGQLALFNNDVRVRLALNGVNRNPLGHSRPLANLKAGEVFELGGKVHVLTDEKSHFAASSVRLEDGSRNQLCWDTPVTHLPDAMFLPYGDRQ